MYLFEETIKTLIEFTMNKEEYADMVEDQKQRYGEPKGSEQFDSISDYLKNKPEGEAEREDDMENDVIF